MRLIDDSDEAIERMAGRIASPHLTHDAATFIIRTVIEGLTPPQGEPLSKDELNQMVADPRYWRERDPDFIKKVSDGFVRLYPD